MSNFQIKLIVVAVMAISLTLSIASLWGDSIIVDEVPHIGAGYSYLVKRDMRLNPEHPPLAKDLAALPLLFLKLKQTAFKSEFWQTDINGQWNFGRQLIFGSGNNADLIAHAAKITMVVFFVLAAILIYKWAKLLYGNAGGLIALTLFAFSPTVIAHSRFVTTDVPALFGVLLATYCLIQHFKTSTRKSLFIAGLAFGVALLLKFSTFLLVPYFLLLAMAYGLINIHNKFRAAGQMVWCAIKIFVIGFVLVVWPVYYFHTVGYPPERQYRDTQSLLSSYGNRKFADPVVWASNKPILRAVAHYGLGLLMVNQRAIGGNTTYFLGEVSRFGWQHYFPIVYFLKESLAWWTMVLIAVLYAAWQWKYPIKEWVNRGYHWVRKNFDEFAMLLWLIIYWGLSIYSTLNIGVRHLLPVYPFAIILVSGQLAKIVSRHRNSGKTYSAEVVNIKNGSERTPKFYILIFTLCILLGWYILETIRVYPYFLTYFNQIAGGPAGGHRYVVDSNLDWGQDLKRFSDWVKENNVSKIELDYFGWADPYYYLRDRYIWTNSTKYRDANDFKARNQSDGWLAVSATFLMGSQGPYDDPKDPNYLWLNSYRPVTVIGNSIFVYRIR